MKIRIKGGKLISVGNFDNIESRVEIEFECHPQNYKILDKKIEVAQNYVDNKVLIHLKKLQQLRLQDEPIHFPGENLDDLPF